MNNVLYLKNNILILYRLLNKLRNFNNNLRDNNIKSLKISYSNYSYYFL